MYREIARLRTAKDSIDVRRCPPILFSSDDTVGHESACRDLVLVAVNRRYAIASCERNYQIAIFGNISGTVRNNDHAAVRYGGESGDGVLDISGVILDASGHNFD